MSNLSVTHLRMLEAIEQTSTLSQAAEQLHVTQSALTHRIREAERRLGVTLFEKSGRHLRLTSAAQVLTEAAVKMLSDLDAAERVAIASAKGIQHIVRITVANYNAYHWLPGFLPWFQRLQPGIDIEIVPGTAASAFEQMAQGQVDIAIVPNQVVSHSCDVMELFQDELVVVVWPEHPFACKSYVSAKDFENQIYLTYSLHSQPGFESERLWAAGGVTPLRKRNLGSIDAVCELVTAQAGISILSRWGVHRQINSGSLKAIQATEQGLDISWRAIVSNRMPDEAAGRIVLEALRDWFSQKDA